MDDYLEHYQLFYEQKINIQSKNPLHSKCKGCESDKTFSEDLKELSISCGDDDDDNCGEQFKVILPTYIHKDKSIKELNENLKSGYDDSGYNYSLLHKYNIIDSSSEGDKFVEEQKEAIRTINDKYNESLGDITEKIKEFYENRMNLLAQSRQIMNTIKTTQDNDELIKEKRREYFGIVKQLNNEYANIYNSLKDSNEYLMIEDPDVDIINENYKENLKPNKKNKKKNKSFISACDKIMCPEKIYNNKDFKSWAVKNHPDKKKGKDDEENDAINSKFQEVSDCRDKGKFCSDENVVPIPKKKKKKKKEKRDVKEPKAETAEINVKVDSDKKELTIKDFKVGDNVEWKKNNKTFTGVVTEVNPKKKNSVKVVDNQSGKEQNIKINTLKIIE